MIPQAIFAATASAEVHNLTSGNFAEFIGANEKTLVKFFAPWCGHCKSMAPDYIAASEKADIDGKVKFAEIDVTEHTEIGDEFEIQGFPTLMYFENGKPTDYDGGRSEADFTRFIDIMTSDPVNTIASNDEAVTADSIAFIARCEKDSEQYKAFYEVAASNRTMGKFMHIESKDNVIGLSRLGSTEVNDIEFTENLSNKLKVEKLELFGRVSGENFVDYMDTELDIVWYASTEDQMSEVKSVVEGAAADLRGKVNFVWIDSAEFERQIEGMLGVTTEDLPVLVRTLDKPGKFTFAKSQSITTESIKEWFNAQEDGTLKPELRSEEIPESNDSAVTTIVGRNFNDIVTEDKDVMLMIHAPWCGHCKNFMPEFNAAARIVKEKSPDTIIAILDGTANELDNIDYQFQGFPTVFFKKAGTVTPTMYNGSRDANGVLKFLSTNVKNAFTFEEIATNVEDEL